MQLRRTNPVMQRSSLRGSPDLLSACGRRADQVKTGGARMARSGRGNWRMSGLLALLDDVVALAKVAATTIDDAAAQAGKAGAKAAGIVIDDAAVTPRYVTGLAAKRELPIIGRIALGSLKNKLLFLLPAALILSKFAPWAITPILMLGGFYLAFEGYEKVHHMLVPETKDVTVVNVKEGTPEAARLEDQRVAGAIRTDFILSAEIMAIALNTITPPDGPSLTCGRKARCWRWLACSSPFSFTAQWR